MSASSALSARWAQRSRARTRGDLLYLLYLVAMVVVVIGLPALLSAGRALARPDVIALLLSPQTPRVAPGLALAGAAGLVGLGAVRGPALLPPFTATLAAGPMLPPHRAAAPLRTRPAAAAAGRCTACRTPGGDARGGRTRRKRRRGGASSSAGSGWDCCGAVRGRWASCCVRRKAAAGPSVGLAALAVVPPLLAVADAAGGRRSGTARDLERDRRRCGRRARGGGRRGCGAVRGPARPAARVELAAQAARWEAATTTAASTDFRRGGFGTFRALPTTGRRLRAIGAGPCPPCCTRAGTPSPGCAPRTAALAARSARCSARSRSAGRRCRRGPTAWALLVLGTLLLRAGAGAFVDGIRHGVHTLLGAPPLLGQRAGTQLLLHAIAPGLLLAVLGAFGVFARVTIGDLAGTAVLLPVAVAAVGPRRAGPRGVLQGHAVACPRYPDPDPAGRPLRAGHARPAGRRPRRADARRGRAAARAAGRSRGRAVRRGGALGALALLTRRRLQELQA